MILSYAYPAPRKKISVASLQLCNVSRNRLRAFRSIDVLNVVLPKIYSKFIADRSTLSISF